MIKPVILHTTHGPNGIFCLPDCCEKTRRDINSNGQFDDMVIPQRAFHISVLNLFQTMERHETGSLEKKEDESRPSQEHVRHRVYLLEYVHV